MGDSLPTVTSYPTLPVHVSCECIYVFFLPIIYFAVLPSCSLNEYVCASGGCVSASLRCDGHDNCLDSSDEVSPLARPSHLTLNAPLSETVHKCNSEAKTEGHTSRYFGYTFEEDTNIPYQKLWWWKKTNRSQQVKVDKQVNLFKLNIYIHIYIHSTFLISEWIMVEKQEGFS